MALVLVVVLLYMGVNPELHLLRRWDLKVQFHVHSVCASR